MTTMPSAEDSQRSDAAAPGAARIHQFAGENGFYSPYAKEPRDVLRLMLMDLRAYGEQHGLSFASANREALALFREQMAGPRLGPGGLPVPVCIEDDDMPRHELELPLVAAAVAGDTEEMERLRLAGHSLSDHEHAAMRWAIHRAVPVSVAFLLEHGEERGKPLRYSDASMATFPERRRIEEMLAASECAEVFGVRFHVANTHTQRKWEPDELAFLGACEANDAHAVSAYLAKPTFSQMAFLSGLNETENFSDEVLATGFARAARANALAVVEAMAKHAPRLLKMRESDTGNRLTALVAAAHNGHEQMSLRLLQLGAPAEDMDGQAVIEAAGLRSHGLLRVLLVEHRVHASSAGELAKCEDEALYRCLVSTNRDDTEGLDLLLAHGASLFSKRGAEAMDARRLIGGAATTERLARAFEEQRAQAERDRRRSFDDDIARGEGWNLNDASQVEVCPAHLRPLHIPAESILPRHPFADDWDARIHVTVLAMAGHRLHTEAADLDYRGCEDAHVFEADVLSTAAELLREDVWDLPPGIIGRALRTAESVAGADETAAEEAAARELAPAGKGDPGFERDFAPLIKAIGALACARAQGAGEVAEEPVATRPRR